MENTDIISKVREELTHQADPKTSASVQHFFKQKVTYHGVSAVNVGVISKKYYVAVKNLPKKELYRVCEGLLKSGYGEEAWIAANWTHWFGNFDKKDMKIYEVWIDKYINDWAKCDTFCNHTVGDLIIKYPELIQTLKKWAKSPNPWLRRAASVSLIIPARTGKFLPDIFEIAEILLTDREDLVQKGYGWMLKVAGNKHQKEVFDFVVKNKQIMPRTALRYAIEKMPPELRKTAMEK
jgi:3-methyladenine DNA glycosylase AlkD